MNKSFRGFLGLLGVSMALAAQPVFALSPGQKLSDAQIAQLGEMPVYKIGRIELRRIPSQGADDGVTLLLDRQGGVGLSRNELTVAGVTESDLQARIAQVFPQPSAVQHFESTGITVVRYADFAQAVDGLRALKKALPEATVRLNVQFNTKVPY
ncbi:hypothetical protein LKR43_05680 [Pusillimonas sp. MFBS29]|uniref:hypothetical protein n=1 Tax=Pusillimonas sp. MFBS29 TaxID=2886690 RepID=UPI001D113A92|nr:hypothetical protein [Pusillimonas sp. MFBS29]MCC2595826.1 hypothetical protein [Pusillimonas sp. MFBS29]